MRFRPRFNHARLLLVPIVIVCSAIRAASAAASGPSLEQGGASVRAELTAPAPSSTLAAATVQFQWSAGAGVTVYELEVGTAAFGNDLFSQASTTNLSQTVTGLPTNGSAVYVQLWSLIDDRWYFNAYTFTAVTGSTSLPSGQKAADIGSPAIVGGTSYQDGIYTITAGGNDIWGTADQFHYVYQPVTGDVEIVARVTGITYADEWSKAAVMIRESLTASSRHATAFISAGDGYAFPRRIDTGGFTTPGPLAAGAPPGWVRLVRTGNRLEAFRSTNGTTWTSMGFDTIPMANAVFVGLAVTSHNESVGTTAVIDNVKITLIANTGNKLPSVTLNTPTNGASFTPPANVALSATASDPENRLSRVEFYAGSTRIGTASAAPFSMTWPGVGAGTYTLTAMAFDLDGGTATSNAATITVQTSAPPPAAPKQVTFRASADHGSSLLTNYVLDIFDSGADPATASPVASSDLGKPAPAANSDITVNRASLFSALPAGTYLATVSAVGPGGQSRSAPASFTR